MSEKQKFYNDKSFGTSINPRHVEIDNQLRELDMHFNRVLDVGCGAGQGLNFIKRDLNIGEAYGIDISSDALGKVDELSIKGICLDLDNDYFPFKDEFFDLVLSIEVIEHLYNPDLYLSEIYRVLKPNGIFIISTPNLSWWVNLLSILAGYQPYYTDTSLKTSLGHLRGGEYFLGHLRSYTPNGLLKLVELHKFKLIKKFGMEFIHWKNGVRFFDQFVKKLMPKYACHVGLVLTKEGLG